MSKKFSVTLTDTEHSELTATAENYGMPVANLAEYAIRKFLTDFRRGGVLHPIQSTKVMLTPPAKGHRVTPGSETARREDNAGDKN